MPVSTADRVFFPVSELIDASGWPFPNLVPDEFEDLWITSPDADLATSTLSFSVLIRSEVTLRLPGIDAFTLIVSPTSGGTALNLAFSADPFSVTIEDVELILRVDADVLRPVKPGTDGPDMSVDTFDIALGQVNLGVDVDGNVSFGTGTASMPRCIVGASGVIIGVGTLEWVTPGDGTVGAPTGFTGLHLDDVEVSIPSLPELGDVRMDDVFLGTGGFTGRVSDTFSLGWNGSDFTGDVHGDLFGFKGALAEVSIEFRQNALVGCSIAGDLFVPYLDKRIGLQMGLTGNGSLSASASVPHTSDPGVTAGSGAHLLHLDVLGVMALDLDAIRFEAPAGRTALIELSGQVQLTVPGLDMPGVDVKALRITADGEVDIEGGWLDLPSGALAPFHGFPLELSRIGFGTDQSATERRSWIGLNGGLKLADGLPVGASVEGLRISWNADAPTADVIDSLSVSLEGVGLELVIPGAVEFAGSVSFFDGGDAAGFRGNGRLILPAVGVSIDVNVVVGRTDAGETFFYFHLGVDLPAGIPLFQTGAAFYGFQGLVANGMAPDRDASEPWYHGWYARSPRGATHADKWGVRSGAFAVGAGTTVGTFPDNGLAFHTSVLLIIVLPGPVLMLEGKGNFLKPRAGGSGAEGAFEALLVLDVPEKLFQANLTATYEVPYLLKLRGSVEVGASWASPPPPHMWHVYLGENTPVERRWQAELLGIFQANAYFMVEQDGLDLGAWIGWDEDWTFGPVRVWARAEIEGSGEVSWAPAHFHGMLHLGGELGVSAFGARVLIAASADIDASGPTPWHVAFDLKAWIEIDLWLFDFSWEHTIHLEWKEPTPTLPQPALPVVSQVAHEHLVVSEGGALSGATIAPDGHPVVIFKRPVRDLPRIGAPGSPTLPGDPVSPDAPMARFSYQLAHVVLMRRTGGDTVVAAAGFAQVSGTSATLPGIETLPDVAGATWVSEGTTVEVTAAGPGTLTFATAPPAGTVPYRLRGPRASADVTISTWTGIDTGRARATLTADPGIARDALGGGELVVGGSTYVVEGNEGAALVVRAPGALPATGAARARGPLGPLLEGVWLPDPDDPVAKPTKLFLGARTPFALFRFTEGVSDGFTARHPGYACGPEAVEEPICAAWDELPEGQLDRQWSTSLLDGDAHLDVVVSSDKGANRTLEVGRTQSGGGQGVVGFVFAPAVEEVRVTGVTDEWAEVVGMLAASDVVSAPLGRDRDAVTVIKGEFDRVEIRGQLATIERLCFLPGWVCTAFEEASFPAKSTGRQSHAGFVLETAGRMSVDVGVLTVAAPPRAPKPKPKPPAVQEPPRVPIQPPDVIEPKLPELIDIPDLPRIPIGPVPRPPLERPRPERWANLLHVSEPVRPRMIGDPRLEEPSVAPRTADIVRPSGLDQVQPSRVLGAGPVELWIYLPRPVTRARVSLRSKASVDAFAGAEHVAGTDGVAGDDVALRSPDGWFDRLRIAGARSLRLDRVCLEAGDLGWKRFEQWAWRTSVQRSIESFYQESPVLAPGDYRLQVVTGWADEITGPGPATWHTENVEFTVGPPPGLGAGEGPLNDLATYVDSTLPAPGDRPFYRSYDVAVAFKENYVSRMFLTAGSPLSVAVVDANGADVRAGAANVWGRGTELAMSAEEQDWMATLHSDGVDACATIDTSRVVRNEAVHAGAGELLHPSALHRGELRAAGKALFSFDFVTSRYARFIHHLAGFDGRCRAIAPPTANADATALVALLEGPRAALYAAAARYAAAAAAVDSGTPSGPQLVEWRAAKAALAPAREAMRAATDAAWEAGQSQLGLPAGRALPPAVTVSRAGNALVIESDEPILWERVSLEVRTSTSIPIRRREFSFTRESFGAPDAGTFRHAGMDWTSSTELWLRNGSVTPRVAGTAWTLDIACPGARSVTFTVLADPGGTASLVGAGDGVSGTATLPSPVASGAQKLTVTAASLSSVRMTATDISIIGVTVLEPFEPVVPAGPVRLAGGRAPSAPSDGAHRVDVVAFARTDLSGWRVRWTDALTPGVAASDYHRFADGYTLEDARIARVYGGRATSPGEAGIDVLSGGLAGVPGSAGVIFSLVDPTGAVVDELAIMPTAGALVESSLLVPNGDGTRALLMTPGTPLTPFRWTLRMTFARDNGPALPVLSVGGVTSPETGEISFSVV